MNPDYRNPPDCDHCGRARVQWDGVCEKCWWDQDAHEYATVSRPAEYPPRLADENDPFGVEDGEETRDA